jgi:hypothetical protein
MNSLLHKVFVLIEILVLAIGTYLKYFAPGGKSALLYVWWLLALVIGLTMITTFVCREMPFRLAPKNRPVNPGQKHLLSEDDF